MQPTDRRRLYEPLKNATYSEASCIDVSYADLFHPARRRLSVRGRAQALLSVGQDILVL